MDLNLLKIIKPRVNSTEPVAYDFDEVLAAVRHIGQKLMPNDRPFLLPPDRFEFYTQLIYYFFNDNKFQGDLGKGLLIRGGKGTGKTMAMNIFRTIGFNGGIHMAKAFRNAHCDEVVHNYEMNGPKSLQQYFSDNWYFDDLGQESKHTVSFGTPRNVMKDILTRRHRMFVERGTMTFVTTNFNYDLIKNEYDTRVEDRFNEMFNDIILDGKSLR